MVLLTYLNISNYTGTRKQSASVFNHKTVHQRQKPQWGIPDFASIPQGWSE